VSCNKLNLLCDGLGLVGRVGSSVSNSVFSSIAGAFGNTADSAINWLWRQLSSSTSVSLGGANFELDLGIVVSIAVVICLGLFVIQMAISALRRDAGGVGRALRGLVIATVGCAITLASLNVLLAAVDRLCVGIVKVATGGTIATLGSKIIGGAVFTTAFASAPTVLLLSLVALVAVAIVWFALVIRKMLILITAIFAPLAFAGGAADFSRGWIRKWLEAMLALVFSKLILIIIFVIGLGVLGGTGSTKGGGPLTSITGEITGLLILLVAGFSPWMALRLVHFTGDHAATLAQSATHARAGASTVVGAPQMMAQLKYSATSLANGHSSSLAPKPDVGSSSRGGDSSFGARSPSGSGPTGGSEASATPTATNSGQGISTNGHGPADAVTRDHGTHEGVPFANARHADTSVASPSSSSSRSDLPVPKHRPDTAASASSMKSPRESSASPPTVAPPIPPIPHPPSRPNLLESQEE
jgi:type IV secretion system protein TrbL